MDMKNVPNSGLEAIIDEAEGLIWALLDDQIDNADTARLSKLVEEHALVRARYVECVQLHVDLHQHFAQKGPSQTGSIMPNLYPTMLGLPAAPGITPNLD